MGLVKIVEGMEKLLLSSLLSGDELDVVDEEEVDIAVLGTKLRRSIVADGVDELVGEALRREVEQAKRGIEAGDLMTDGMKEVGLAKTDAAVDEERIVGFRWQLGHRMARGLRKLVRVADDEGIERVASGKTGGSRRRCIARHARHRSRRGRFALDLEGDARRAAENLACGG